jgi:hypothetical protein
MTHEAQVNPLPNTTKQNQVASLEPAFAGRFIQRNGDGSGRYIAISMKFTYTLSIGAPRRSAMPPKCVD